MTPNEQCITVDFGLLSNMGEHRSPNRSVAQGILGRYRATYLPEQTTSTPAKISVGTFRLFEAAIAQSQWVSFREASLAGNFLGSGGFYDLSSSLDTLTGVVRDAPELDALSQYQRWVETLHDAVPSPLEEFTGGYIQGMSMYLSDTSSSDSDLLDMVGSANSRLISAGSDYREYAGIAYAADVYLRSVRRR